MERSSRNIISRLIHLLLAVVGRGLVLPEHHGPLGLGAALQEGAAVLHAVHGLIQEGRLAAQLVYAERKQTNVYVSNPVGGVGGGGRGRGGAGFFTAFAQICIVQIQ